MPPMSDDEIRSFLSAGTRTGKLATTRRDGRPHVTPIWFVLDGDDVIVEGDVELSVRTSSMSWCGGRRASAAGTWARTGPRSTGAATASRASSLGRLRPDRGDQ